MKLEPRVLENAHARLEPLADAHRGGLRAAASDPAIWRWFPMRGDGEHFDGMFTRYTEAGSIFDVPFAVRAPAGALVGVTTLMNARVRDAGVEIGGTWYAPSAQGGSINPACKLLLMKHAFESGAERVELKTDALNARSRAAILKLGARFEGIHRHHMRRPDGSWRDTAWFSVLSAEWPDVKAGLEARLAAFG